jgi:hypothetical protein
LFSICFVFNFSVNSYSLFSF